MPWGQSDGTNFRKQTRLWDSYPMKSPNLRYCQARSHRTRTGQSYLAMDWPIPSHTQAREGSQSWKGAIVAPERHHLPNCKQASLLTKTSWDLDSRHPPGGSQPEISSPEETHSTPEKVSQLYTQKTKRQGQGRGYVAAFSWGQLCLPST